VPMDVDYLRWAVPLSVAEDLGWAQGGCACCGTSDVVKTEHTVHIDTAWHEVHWWFDNGEKPAARDIKRERKQIH
jgi:hypothetical protein